MVTLLPLKNDDCVFAEFGDHLAASAARRAWNLGAGDYGHGPNLELWRLGLANSREDRRTLRAIGQTVGRVFHVASGEDLALLGEHSSANVKVGVWRVGFFEGLAGSVEKRIALGGGE